MKVLITGGTGFVGRHFVNSLAAAPWEIVLLTRRRSNAEGLKNISRVYEGDASDPQVVERLVAGEKQLDVVFHLAASLIYFSKWSDIRRFNVVGTQNMLEVATRTGAQKFIYASSIEAAGAVRATELPAPTARPPRPISSYGRSKVLAERAVRQAAAGRFQAAILRIGNVYGPGHLNFITFIADSILNRTRVLEFLPYYRDRYLHPAHSQDVTNGLMAAYACKADMVTATLAGESSTVGNIFDVCAEVMGKRYPCREGGRLVDKIYLAVRRDYHRLQGGGGDFITYLMAGGNRSPHRAYALDELIDVIGYRPQFSLREGIRDCVEWARSAGQLVY